MYRSSTPGVLKSLLQGLSKFLLVVCGVCFLFGDRVFIAFGKMDFIFAELLGIGLAFLCLIASAVAQHKIEDLDWKKANEDAVKESEKPTKS